MAEASREGYRELGRVRPGIKLGRPRHPTIVNGRLYLRGDREVVCYRITSQGNCRRTVAWFAPGLIEWSRFFAARRSHLPVVP